MGRRLDRARATTPEAEERIRRCNERAEFAQRKRDSLVQRSTIRRVRTVSCATGPFLMRHPLKTLVAPVLLPRQTRGTPVLKRLPYFKVYRNRQDEVYNMLCTPRCRPCTVLCASATRFPALTFGVCVRARLRPPDDPGYNPDAELDDDHSALDTFPVILLAAGYKGVSLRNDSLTMTELGRLSCCVELQKNAGGWSEDPSMRRAVLGRDGRPVSAQTIGPFSGWDRGATFGKCLTLTANVCYSRVQTGCSGWRHVHALRRRRRRPCCCGKASGWSGTRSQSCLATTSTSRPQTTSSTHFSASVRTLGMPLQGRSGGRPCSQRVVVVHGRGGGGCRRGRTDERR